MGVSASAGDSLRCPIGFSNRPLGLVGVDIGFTSSGCHFPDRTSKSFSGGVPFNRGRAISACRSAFTVDRGSSTSHPVSKASPGVDIVYYRLGADADAMDCARGASDWKSAPLGMGSGDRTEATPPTWMAVDGHLSARRHRNLALGAAGGDEIRPAPAYDRPQYHHIFHTYRDDESVFRSMGCSAGTGTLRLGLGIKCVDIDFVISPGACDRRCIGPDSQHHLAGVNQYPVFCGGFCSGDSGCYMAVSDEAFGACRLILAEK